MPREAVRIGAAAGSRAVADTRERRRVAGWSVQRRRPSRWQVLVPGALLAVAWELSARVDLASDRVLPSLTEVVSGIPHVITDPSARFTHHLGITLSEVGLGYAGAVTAGLLVGALVAASGTLRRVLYPLVVMFEVIPKVALTPLLIVGLGFGISSKAAVAGLLAFFPVFINTMSGLDYPGKDGDVLLRSMGAGALRRLRHFGVPRALPSIFAGLKVGLTMAFIGAIVAELLTLQSGLGFLMNSFKGQLRIDYAYAATLLVAVLGTLLFFAMEQVERRIVFWSRHSRPDLSL